VTHTCNSNYVRGRYKGLKLNASPGKSVKTLSQKNNLGMVFTPVIPAVREAEVGGSSPRPGKSKNMRLDLKNKQNKKS
jgi:hypothetical protein